MARDGPIISQRARKIPGPGESSEKKNKKKNPVRTGVKVERQEPERM